ncbi:MAG: type I methionyl aminopeptidase, partial [Chloroflexi bacterium]|nr:type I methionyl aminopeptidase [Chloroflexota bacterium]
MSITIKSRREIELMRSAGAIVAETLELMRLHAHPGVTTAELDRLAHDLIVSRGASPSFLGYDGFPASICASVNAEIVHGIPNERLLRSGDILSVDVGANLHGYHADAAITLPIGDVSGMSRRLIAATEGAFAAGLAQARAGQRIGDVSAAIQEYAESRGFG